MRRSIGGLLVVGRRDLPENGGARQSPIGQAPQIRPLIPSHGRAIAFGDSTLFASFRVAPGSRIFARATRSLVRDTRLSCPGRVERSGTRPGAQRKKCEAHCCIGSNATSDATRDVASISESAPGLRAGSQSAAGSET